MSFQSRNSHSGPLLKVSKILKSFDKTAFENCIISKSVISKSSKGLSPSIFNNSFKKIFESHLIIVDGQILVILNNLLAY